MFGLGPMELIIVLMIVLMTFGARKSCPGLVKAGAKPSPTSKAQSTQKGKSNEKEELDFKFFHTTASNFKGLNSVSQSIAPAI